MKPLLRDILFPPRCVACNRVGIPAMKGEAPALCADCKPQWEREVVHQCPVCFLAYSNCRCMSAVMEKAGVSSFVKLTPYGEGATYRVTRAIIANIKSRGRRRAFRFLGRELTPGVKSALFAADKLFREQAARPPQTVIAYLPRSRKAKRREGLDQAAELAKALSRETGLPLISLFVRSRDGTSQKKLSQKARNENLHNAFAVKGNPAGLRILLVDDVVTTGAGMSECAKLLRRAGAAEVIAVSVAQTVKKSAEKRK